MFRGNLSRRWSVATSLTIAVTGVLLLMGCGNPDKAAVNPATLTKEQRVNLVESNAKLTPEQKAAKKAQIEQLEKQTQMAKQMAPPLNAPAGLKH